MKILQRHVAKEILVTFALAFVIMTFLALVGDVLHELAGRFMSKRLALSDIGLLILYVLPPLSAYTIPIALLFATLAAFVRLSQDCEIIAIKSAGIPVRKIFVPAIAIGIAATMLLLVLWAEGAPWARRNLKFFLVNMVLNKPSLMLSEQAWTREINNMRIFVGDIGEDEMLGDISIMVRGEGKPDRTIVAESGRVYVDTDRKKIFLKLAKGSIHEYDPERPDQYSTTTFSRLTIPVSIYEVDRYLRKYQGLEHYTEKEMSLNQMIRKLWDQATEPDERRSLLTHIGERTALAFMPLAFVLIGAPLGIIPYKARRFYGLAACGGLLLTYYSLLMLGEMMSRRGLMNPLLAMWTPNLLLGAAGAFFMVMTERR